jgi:hypothetical protein
MGLGIFKRKNPFSKGESRFFDHLSLPSSKAVEGLEVLWTFAENSTRESANVVRNLAAKILRDYPKIASEHAVNAKSYENQVGEAYHLTLADLFKGKDTVYMLKMR